MAEWVGFVFKQIHTNHALGSDLESYILSKNPKNAGDVEYWTQHYFLTRD